jgi:hypothetical protein
MGQVSSIRRLPPELKDAIADLRDRGRTIDEILEHLKKMDEGVDISRSALGRHVKKIDEVARDIRAQRDMAMAIAKDIGDKTQGEIARGNIELLQSLIMRAVSTASRTGELEAKDLMLFSKAVSDLSKGTKLDIDSQIAAAKEQARREATNKAAEVVTKEAKRQGLSEETVNAIKAKILGVA